MQKRHSDNEIRELIRSKEDKRYMLQQVFDEFTRDVIPELAQKIQDSCNNVNNVYQLANAEKLSSANTITRTYSTKLGLLWERIASLSPNVISPEIELGYKIPEVDIIVLYNDVLYYTQLKTQKNTLTGSQTKRTVDELTAFPNHFFVACIDTNCSSTIPSGLNKLVGSEFWNIIGFDYNNEILPCLTKSIQAVESFYINA